VNTILCDQAIGCFRFAPKAIVGPRNAVCRYVPIDDIATDVMADQIAPPYWSRRRRPVGPDYSIIDHAGTRSPVMAS